MADFIQKGGEGGGNIPNHHPDKLTRWMPVVETSSLLSLYYIQ